jgi:protein-S-isoprenylcysteine O-methyltransferase Ste14
MADEDHSRAYLRRARQILIQFGVIAALLFGISGDIHWIWAWAYFGFAILNLAVNFVVFPREIVEARSETHKDVPRWERNITRALLVMTFALFGGAGLDHRLDASPALPAAVQVMGLAVIAAGSALSTWAIASNRFFATQVRIQTERDHVVERGGPYQWIRHPGYAGFIVTWLALPVLLGTLWAFLPALAIAILFVMRTLFEDAFLRRKLPGYAQYSDEVRFRLIPRIW